MSRRHLEANDAAFFSKRLPASLQWRIFSDFERTAVCLDIETNGLSAEQGIITTIAAYDGDGISYYIQGHNLDDFIEDIKKYNVIITYNGKCFDIPYIERYFGIRLPHGHIDLRYVLAGLGCKGGLKACERRFGVDRGDLAGLDGAFAVLLWDDYVSRGNVAALETLLAYNIADAVNLQSLMILAVNELVRSTPFEFRYFREVPHSRKNPFRPDAGTIDRLKRYFISNRYDWFS